MGILNITPDSFYDGGRFLRPEQAADQARRLVDQGADLLDLGAESTRPDADPVSEEEERNRLLPVLDELSESIQIPISIDTTKPGVARRALDQGADIINDVSGLRGDPEMGHVIKDFDAGVVLMHRRGTAKTMQSFAQYEDVVTEVIAELKEGVKNAESNGISLEQIVIDPGIGFSKTADQNLELLRRLDKFEQIGRPILIGPSRKSFIGAVTEQKPEQRLFGTVAACVLALERGARIFRVHDVASVKEALLVAEAILRSSPHLTPPPAPRGEEIGGGWSATHAQKVST